MGRQREEMRGGHGTLPDDLDGVLTALQSEPADAVVYFVRRGRWVKIGTTRDLKARTASLRAHRDPDGDGGKVEVLLTVPGGVYTEAYFHSRFADSRVVDRYGEWFHLTRDVAEFVTLMLHCQRAPHDHFSMLWVRQRVAEVLDAAA